MSPLDALIEWMQVVDPSLLLFQPEDLRMQMATDLVSLWACPIGLTILVHFFYTK